MAKIDYDNLTKQIVEYVGGVENIKTITHCVTRLRLYLNDRNKAEDEKIKNLPGVLGVVYGNQQYQIILGEHLFPVFDNLEKNYSVQTEAPINENLDENLVSGNEKKNFKYYFEKAITFMSQSLTPFITVVYGAGMLKVILSLLSYFIPSVASSTAYTMLNFMSSAPFYFMPVLVAYGTSKVLKSNPAFSMAIALTLVYPERQIEMVRTMLDMYREHGWLPKWELYGRETLTMEGDPSIPVIVDTWMKGLRDFDINLAYEAMYKSATLPGAENLMRPDNDDYMSKGYVPLREQYDNSVSHALEYYIADFALSRLADALGKKEDAKLFYNRSLGYKHYYSKEFGTFRPILPDGTFYSPFSPKQGENFEPSPGFHEGNAWNYTYYVPHDVYGLARLMGGKKSFVNKLQMIFDEGLYDPANEPDIAYPYLFSYFKGEEWRTQKETQRLLAKYFTTQPDGIPGNDDTGTMSTWAIFNMMGFYPDCPGLPEYTLTTPVFDKVIIRLDPKWYKEKELVIESTRQKPDALYIDNVKIGGKKLNRFRITHDELVHGGRLEFSIR